ncbi:MAG: hypothetical protein HUK02_04540, partial [Bacteroidaceae bacterium]|nr:hypothetical protein [Bacteroidaceae bacterium]
MHTKVELERMQPMELVALAQQVNAQITEDIPILIYNILDAEAVIESQSADNSTAKPKRGNAK